MTTEAERLLAQARARVRELSAPGPGYSWERLSSAHDDLLAAEREVARIAGDEYAVELNFEPAWDVGAPLPHLLG